MGNTIIVFAKAPRIGAAKTRLARGIGRYEAWRAYRELTAAAIRAATGPGASLRLAVTPDALSRARFWPVRLSRAPQGPGDLGQRMATAFLGVPRGAAVIVGSDIPGMTAAHFRQAFRTLSRCDAVFGPSADGGYWLIGLKDPRRARRLFKGVRFSGPHALADTLRNAAGMRVAMLESLRDIDTQEDYRAWRRREIKT